MNWKISRWTYCHFQKKKLIIRYCYVCLWWAPRLYIGPPIWQSTTPSPSSTTSLASSYMGDSRIASLSAISPPLNAHIPRQGTSVPCYLWRRHRQCEVLHICMKPSSCLQTVLTVTELQNAATAVSDCSEAIRHAFLLIDSQRNPASHAPDSQDKK